MTEHLHTFIAVVALMIWIICYASDKGGSLLDLAKWTFLVSLGFVYLKGI